MRLALSPTSICPPKCRIFFKMCVLLGQNWLFSWLWFVKSKAKNIFFEQTALGVLEKIYARMTLSIEYEMKWSLEEWKFCYWNGWNCHTNSIRGQILLLVVLNEKESARDWELPTVFNMVVNSTVTLLRPSPTAIRSWTKARWSAEDTMDRTQKHESWYALISWRTYGSLRLWRLEVKE